MGIVHPYPEGELDGTSVTIGQMWGQPIEVKLWKEGKIKLSEWGEKLKSAEVGENGEVRLLLTGIYCIYNLI